MTNLNIEDPNFSKFIIENLKTEIKGKITIKDIQSVRRLNCSNRNIESLEGIEHFINLTHLDCSENQLSDLDLSKNVLLENIDCTSNRIKKLDFSKNTLLTEISCGNNQLTELDLSNNSALAHLFCYRNQIKKLNITDNLTLKELWCFGNPLKGWDINNSKSIIELNCDHNQLKGFKHSSCDSLKRLILYNLELKDCYRTWSIKFKKETILMYEYEIKTPIHASALHVKTAWSISKCNGNFCK